MGTMASSYTLHIGDVVALISRRRSTITNVITDVTTPYRLQIYILAHVYVGWFQDLSTNSCFLD